ncbi:MAG: FIG022979: MoxR-like ATPases, partial [uncultured Thermomicrobiales bacterium]
GYGDDGGDRRRDVGGRVPASRGGGRGRGRQADGRAAGYAARGADLPDCRGPCAPGRGARPRQDDADPHDRGDAGPPVQPDPVHTGSDARRHHRHQYPGRGGARAARIPLPARPDLREPRPRRRNQPCHAEDPVGPAGGDAGSLGDGRQQHLPTGTTVLRVGDAEPAGDGGDLPAAGGATRPLPLQADRALPHGGGVRRDPVAHHHDHPAEGGQSDQRRAGGADGGAGARGADRLARPRLRRAPDPGDPPRQRHRARRRAQVCPLRREPARRAVDRPGGEDSRAARRAAQRRLRGCARAGRARPAPSDRPQLRGRGRGVDDRRGDRRGRGEDRGAGAQL